MPMTPLTPTKLGRYEILDELGKGAMGVVYLARDPLIGRMVALKTFRIAYSVREVEMEQFRARFLREAQSAGILSHPNIVTIHDVVEESEDGLAFIAMEYVQGTNLKMLLQREGALDLAFVSTVLEQVAEAVDYAHSKKVVHRDIKPANIIITADNRVKITDFGIARLDTSNLTQEGQLLGTPNYMAPEQILGHEVDHRADLFSLGVVLYEMLTRHKPFQGENLTVVSHRIVYDQFTPPRQYARQLAPEVEAILQRALEKDPARRYQRAREMADDLRRVASPGLPVSVAGDSLNETQDLSSTSMVLPLTPPPPLPAVDTTLPGGGFGSGLATPPPFPTLPMFPGVQLPDGTGTGVPLAPLAAPAGSPAPARSWLERLGVPPARLANVAFFTALICLVFGTVALLALRPFETLPADLVQPDRRSDVLRLIDQGHQRLRAGDWSGAIQAYGQAETLAPELPGPKRMRARAIQEAAEHTDRVARAQALGGHLERARLAVMTRRYDEAEALARAALAIDGANVEARQILGTVAAERKRPPERQATARRPQIALPTPQPSVQPPLPEPAPAPVEPADPAKTQLLVDFYTDLPAGDIVLFIDGREVRREPFNFYERRGFRRQASGGRVQLPPIRVSPGPVQVRLLVAPKGAGGEVWTATASFEAGQQRRLVARLDRQGKLSVQMP
jgi:serine/threonine protein kinase